MAKVTRIFLTAALVVSALCVGLFAQTPVERHGQLSVKDGKIVDKNNEPVQLRGMSFFWDQWSEGSKFYTAGAVNTLVNDWKVSVVRAAYSGTQGKEALLTTVISAAVDKGIYVIIDWHSHTADNEKTQAIAFFEKMARTHGSKPNIIYEIFNEPIKQTWPTIRSYSQDVVDAIRAIDSKNLIIIGSSDYSKRVDQAAADPVNGTNLAYSVHYYTAEPGTQHQGTLRNWCGIALNKGLALFVTEFGVSEADGGQAHPSIINTEEATAWFKWLDARRISWVNWSICDKGEAASALTSGASNDGDNWSSKVSPSGTFIRNTLRQYAASATLTVNKTGEGSVTPNKTSFDYGEPVTLKAVPAAGWDFSTWTVDGTTSTTDEVTVSMYGAKTVAVKFVLGGNLIKNGTFTSTSNWSVLGEGARALDAAGLKVSVNAVGSDAASVRLGQGSIKLDAGKKYRLTFDARTASGNRTITVRIANSSGSRVYATGDKALTGTMQPQQFEFDMAVTDATASVYFLCGTQTGDWFINNVRLEDIGNATGVAPNAVSASRTASSWSVAQTAGGALKLSGPVEAGARVSLYDTRGKMVRSANAADGMTFGVGVPAGSYLVVVKNRAGSEVMKSRVSLVK